MIEILHKGIAVAIANARTLLMQYRFSQISVCRAKSGAKLGFDIAKSPKQGLGILQNPLHASL